MEIRFDDGYPFQPPFCRVLYPQICGGTTFEHGALCFHSLTVSGWSPAMRLSNLAISLRNNFTGAGGSPISLIGVGDKSTRTIAEYTFE
eukprot:gene20923-55312_t